MTNIDLFNTYVADALAGLYDAFPVKRFVDARKLCGHTEIDDLGQVVDAQGRPSRAFLIAHAALIWLRDEGFIRVGQVSQYGVMEAVLSERGLHLLRKVPEGVRSQETWGDRLSRFWAEGSKELAIEASKTVLSLAIGAALK